ncbi:hypothetical protein B0A50_06074 [Salinomyces thailandicus]|uniref:Transcriptional regulatory protein RXT2 N-terminal domain-containing protein n=1 Tax=Salinomyces thailandicus TaxID=706561 RepID=A0A4U0TSQ6_9PEZI|nr:hypothetical protein B0A50_06074 [Salinomyces thailandica]
MAAQQIAFAETLRAMKLAIRRNRAASPASSSSDSGDDDGLHTHTNRGHKLKRSTRYAKTGRLDTTGGQQAWKRKVQHAGHERYVVNKRPKLYDEDGDVVDPQDLPSDLEEEDQHLYGEPIRENAFGGVRLEALLRPLTSAAELPEHPSLREAYTSKALTQMCDDAADMVRREKAALWKAKRLLQRFRGDGGWMACGKFETEQDDLLLQDEQAEGGASTLPSIVETELSAMPRPEEAAEGVHDKGELSEQDETGGDAMNGVEGHDHFADTLARTEQAEGYQNGQFEGHEHDLQPAENANGEHAQDQAPHPAIAELRDKDDSDSRSSTSNPSAPSHAMTTRARARSPPPATSPSPSPSDSASIPSVHPWFIASTSCLPDRDLGLPPQEAEETRRLLMLYVQKQENIVRQLGTLYESLQRADRLRRETFRACKAEGHMVPDGKGGVMTEMSDGEDWYDPEDWGLTARDLKDGKLEKGKDEVEDVAEEEGRRVGGRRRRVVGKG